MRIWLLSGLLCLSAFLAFGQDPYHICITQTEGAPSNTIYDVFQDSRGYVWLANNEGLTRYDGFEFKTYYSPKQTSTPGSSIYEDTYKRIWYQNFDGYLYYLENDTLHALEQKKPIGFIPFGVVGNNLFTLNRLGIDVYNLRTLKNIKTIDLNIDNISSSYFDKEHFTVMDSKNLYRLNKNLELKSYLLPTELTVDIPTKIYGNNSRNIIVTRNNKSRNAYTFDKGQIKKLFRLEKPIFTQFVSYIDNKYWVCTNQGLFVYNENGIPLNDGKPYFETNSISKIFKDRQANYWISTTDKGIFLVPEWNTRKLKDPERTYTKIYYSNNGFYVGTKNSELLYFDRNLNNREVIFKNQSAFPVSFILEDTINQSMIIENGGIYQKQNDQYKLISGMAMKSACQIDEKYYAITSSGNTSLMKHPSANSKFNSSWDKQFNSAKIDEYFAILINGIRGKAIAYSPILNKIYNVNNLGLFSISPDEIVEIKKDGESIFASNIICYDRYLYILSNQKNLFRMSPDGKFDNMNLMLDLPASSIQKIKLIGNLLYLITQKSVIELDLLNPSIKQKLININISPYAISDLESAGDKLYLIADGSIITVNKNNTKKSENDVPYFNINSLKSNGKEFDILIDNEFAYRSNNIEINYSILSFGKAQDPTLFYSINNGNWEKTSNETRTLKFPALLPGTYDISFKFGDDSQSILANKISFSIQNPYWKRWWFILLIVLFGISSVFIYYKIKTENLIKKNVLITDKMNLEQELSKSILSSIKSQMNPHFLFNALNTIQSFIYSDDKLSAGNYLGKFSKLTRMILEMSEKEIIHLSEEIYALSLYLELEKMRFQEDFEFYITIDKNVDAESIKTPPMIIQPFVENAIKHGLLHQSGEKILKISFAIKEQNLLVTIEDNGIGRQRSSELNQLKKDKHISFSSKANEKRLEILNRGTKNKVGIEYIDKTNHENRSLGTIVKLTIPFQI